MAVDLSAEIKKLNGGDSEDSGDDESDIEALEKPDDTSTDETDAEPTPTPEAPIKHEGPPVLTFADYSAAGASPTTPPTKYPTIAEDQTGAPVERAQPVTYPTIAEDQQGPPVLTFADYAAQPETATVPAGHIDLGPPGRNIYTDPDTGGRYVVDPDTGQMVPHAELATPADKAPQPSGGVQLPQIDVTGTAPAPDRLTQVERAQLVKLPTAAPAPDTLTQVERGQLVNVPRGTQPAPGTLSQVEKGIALPPKVQPAQPVTGAPQPPVQPPQPVAGRILTFADYASGAAYKPQQPVAAQPVTQPPAGGVPAEPKIDIQAQSYTKGRTQEPSKLILHSTDGSSEKADINTLTGSDPGHRVSVNYYVTKDGRVMHFVSEGDTAWHAGADRYGGNGNAYTLGIEQQHVDGKEPWPDAQVRATAGVAAGILARHPNMTIDDVIGHSDLAGERKQDPVDYPWAKFRQYVAEAQGQHGAGQPATAGQPAAVPSAQPATKLKTGFYEGEKPGDFLTGRVTTFATPDDIASGQDNGRGAPKLGGVDTTQVAGVAIPQEALEQMFGRDWAAAARAARVDVVDPATGKRLRVPIVDLGPNTDAVSDMTPALSAYFGGDKNLSIKIVPKAGPDVMKNPQLFNDEQAAIKGGFDSSTVGRAVQKAGVSQLPMVAQTPEKATAAQQKGQEAIQKQQDIVSKLPEAGSGNAIGFYKRLDDSVDGVTPQMRTAIQAQLKPQIIAAMREKFPELKTDDEAWAKAQSDVGVLDVGRDWATKALGYGQQFTNVMQKGVAGTDQLHVNQFLDSALPGANDQQKHEYLTKLYAMPEDQRIAEVQSRLPQPQTGVPSTDPQQIVSALDRLSDPNFQKQQQADLDKAAAEMKRNVSSDPRLQGTGMEKVINATAQMPAFVAAFSNPVLMPAAMAQVSDQVRETFKQQHPEWSDAELTDKSAYATLVQFYGQVAANHILMEGGGALLSGVEGRGARAISQAILSTGSMAAISGGTQAITNVIGGQPPGAGVREAATTGAIQGLVGGVVHGAGELIRPGERAAVAQPPPVQPTEEPPPVQPPVQPTEGQVQPQVQSRAEQAQRRGAIVDVLKKVRDDPDYEPTPEERALIGEWNQRADKDDLFYSASANTADNRENEHPQMQAALDRILAQPTQEALNRDEPPPVEPKPADELAEEDLNQRNRDLYDRYKLEGQLPVEEKPVPADITQDEQRATEQAQAEQAVGEGEQRPGKDLGEGPEPVVSGRELERGGETVPPELGRLQGALDTKLSPEESAAFEPDRQALRNGLDQAQNSGQQPELNPSFRDAYVALRARVLQRFQPLLDAIGVRAQVHDPKFGSAFAAGADRNGDFHLVLNDQNGARYIAAIMEHGGDPVQYLHSIAQEELVHFAHHDVLKNEWLANGGHGSGEDFSQYGTRRNFEVIRDLARARDEARDRGDMELHDHIDNAIKDSLRLYQSKVGVDAPAWAEKRLQDMLTRGVLGDHNDVSNAAYELVRQLSQLQAREPITESHAPKLWNAIESIKKWYQKALTGLRRLYRSLRPGQALAKTQLADLLRAVTKRLKDLDRLTGPRGKAAPSAPPAMREGGVSPEAPKLSEALRRFNTWHSMALKGGESSMLDYDETRPLGLALRRKQGFLQRFGQQGRLTQLEDAFRAVNPGDRARVKDEFTRYITAEQNKQPLPAVGADTMRVINAGKDTLQQMGQIAKSLDLHVKQSDGKVRPMQLIGRNYYPRMISRDTMDIFNQRDGARKADFDALVNRQIARGVVNDRQEFIDKFTHAFSGDMSSNEHFSNLEKAREQQLPLDFYDFGPEALLRYATRSRDRLAQAAAYGQKLSNEGKDMFDHTIEEVNNSGNLSQEQKQMIVTRINQERQAEYQQAFRNNFDKISSLVRGAATGAFVGNPLSALRYVITGQAQNLVYGGPGTFARTFARFLNVPKMMDAMKEVRERNMVRANMADLYHDFDLTTNQGWATKGVQGFTKQMLEWGGHNIADSFNRAVGMQQGKFILEDFAKNWKSGKDTAATRSLYDMIARRGVSRNDFDALARENGNGPLTDEFLRQYVMDVHGNYSPAQNAAHLFDNPAGKMLLQFQKWGNNSFRMATREFIMPLARAAAERKPADFAYQLARNVGFVAAATGTGLSIQMVQNWLKGRDPNDPSVQDVWTRFSHGDGLKALQWALARAWGAIHISGFLGILDNYMDLARQATGEAPGPTTKDPMHPPGESLLQPFMSLIQGWRGEGGAAPSPELIDQFAGSILSQYRVAKQLNDGFARVSGLHTPFSEEQLAQNDQSFLRSRVKMYEDENPVIQQKFAEKGRAQAPMAQRSEFSPFRDQIHAALLSGNQAKAMSVIRSWLDRFPPEEQKAQIKGLKIGIQASSPIKAGGSTSADSTLGFLDWAKKNLPEGEARKIFALSETYAKTALATGIEGNSKTMNKLASSTYDNYRPAAVQRQAQAAAQGRASMQQLIQRQRIATQLQAR